MVDETTNTPAGTQFEPAVPLRSEAGTVEFDPAVSETKRTATETIKDEAGKLGTQAADRARAFAGDGKAKATGAINEFARMMEDAATQVDDKLGQQYGQYARSAAQSLGGFASSLESKDIDELLEDVRDFVRKSPAVAIGAAAAVGFVLARVVKAGVDGASDEPTSPGS